MRPRSARVVPQPRRPRGRPRLRLTHALLASDLNPSYLDFWPLARRAWSEIAGLEPLLVLVAEEADVPEALRADASVRVFPPLPGVHTALQAQCVRLLYPAVLDVEGGIVTSDADMVPMNAGYLHRPAAEIDATHFIAYRDVLLGLGEIPICYNAALPSTWRRVLEVESHADIRARLAEWASTVEYSGSHGGSGWGTDQQILHRTLLEHGRRTATVWILDDYYTRFRRLDRSFLRKHTSLDAEVRRLIARGAYSDFHCLTPHAAFRELNEAVVELAIAKASTFRART